MYHSDKIKLLVVQNTKDSQGYTTEQIIKETPLYADAVSATRDEQYKAMAAGHKIDVMFKVSARGWNNAVFKNKKGGKDRPTVVEYCQELYDIKRSYSKDRVSLELSCTRRE